MKSFRRGRVGFDLDFDFDIGVVFLDSSYCHRVGDICNRIFRYIGHSLRRRLGLGGLLDDGDRCDRVLGLRMMWLLLLMMMWKGMELGRGFLVRRGVNMDLGVLRIYLVKGMIVRGGRIVVVVDADADAHAGVDVDVGVGGDGVCGEDTSV